MGYPEHAGFDGVFIDFDSALHSVALWVDQKVFPWGSCEFVVEPFIESNFYFSYFSGLILLLRLKNHTVLWLKMPKKKNTTPTANLCII